MQKGTPSFLSNPTNGTMRKIQSVVLLFCVLLAVGCSNDNERIRAAAQGYLDAMGNYRPSEARAYATEETCDVTLAFFETMMQYTDSSVYANNIPATVTLGEITIEDDTVATVAFHKHTPTVEQDGTVHLVCRNGDWRVHEVIKIPDMLNPSMKPRTFTPEELAEMRKNGKQNVGSVTRQ